MGDPREAPHREHQRRTPDVAVQQLAGAGQEQAEQTRGDRQPRLVAVVVRVRERIVGRHLGEHALLAQLDGRAAEEVLQPLFLGDRQPELLARAADLDELARLRHRVERRLDVLARTTDEPHAALDGQVIDARVREHAQDLQSDRRGRTDLGDRLGGTRGVIPAGARHLRHHRVRAGGVRRSRPCAVRRRLRSLGPGRLGARRSPALTRVGSTRLVVDATLAEPREPARPASTRRSAGHREHPAGSGHASERRRRTRLVSIVAAPPIRRHGGGRPAIGRRSCRGARRFAPGDGRRGEGGGYLEPAVASPLAERARLPAPARAPDGATKN